MDRQPADADVGTTSLGGRRVASTGRPRHLLVAVALTALTALAALTACGPGGHSDAPSPAGSSGPSGTRSSTPRAGGPTSSPSASMVAVTKVLTIVLENHGPAAVTAHMPGLVGLAHTYGQTSRYHALTHPSLPNYLALAGGSTFGVTDDAPPAAHRVPGPCVFDLAVGAGRTARTYAEAMPARPIAARDHSCLTAAPNGLP